MQLGIFGIGEFTGEVTLQAPLDYEVHTFYQLEITAMASIFMWNRNANERIKINFWLIKMSFVW